MWDNLHKLLLDTLNDTGEIGWSRASLDSQTVSASGVKKGRQKSKASAQTRRIRANQARSAILWSADEEYLLR